MQLPLTIPKANSTNLPTMQLPNGPMSYPLEALPSANGWSSAVYNNAFDRLAGEAGGGPD